MQLYVPDRKKWRAWLAKHHDKQTDIGLARMGAGVRPTVAPGKRFTTVPAFFKRALASNRKARENFASLPPSYRRTFVGWVGTAKKEETRRRLQEAIHLLERNQRLGLK